MPANDGRFQVVVYLLADEAQGLAGVEINDDLKSSIVGWQAPPNAPSTIAKKGFNKPLVDTGDMLRSTTYQVRMEGDE